MEFCLTSILATPQVDHTCIGIAVNFEIDRNQLRTEPLWLVTNEQWIKNPCMNALKNFVFRVETPLRQIFNGLKYNIFNADKKGLER